MENEFNSKACDDFVNNVMQDLHGQKKEDVKLIARHLTAYLVMVMKGLEGEQFTKDFLSASINDNIQLIKSPNH